MRALPARSPGTARLCHAPRACRRPRCAGPSCPALGVPSCCTTAGGRGRRAAWPFSAASCCAALCAAIGLLPLGAWRGVWLGRSMCPAAGQQKREAGKKAAGARARVAAGHFLSFAVFFSFLFFLSSTTTRGLRTIIAVVCRCPWWPTRTAQAQQRRRRQPAAQPTSRGIGDRILARAGARTAGGQAAWQGTRGWQSDGRKAASIRGHRGATGEAQWRQAAGNEDGCLELGRGVPLSAPTERVAPSPPTGHTGAEAWTHCDGRGRIRGIPRSRQPRAQGAAWNGRGRAGERAARAVMRIGRRPTVYVGPGR